jgi:Uma2 family endonuclease
MQLPISSPLSNQPIPLSNQPMPVVRSTPPRLRVSEAEYWESYYEHDERRYEWKDGYLEEKPMPDYDSYVMYDWFVTLLKEYLQVRPLAKLIGLDMAFVPMRTPIKSIRKPDLGVVLHSNPISLGDKDPSYAGIFDICVESLSHSKPSEEIRDTVTKKYEYAQAGVKEYYLLDASGEQTACYRLNAKQIYEPISARRGGIIASTVLPGFQFRFMDLERQPSLAELSKDPVYRHFVGLTWQAERQARRQAQTLARAAKKACQLAEAKAQAEQDARQQAEAKAQAEQDARQQAEAKAQAEQDARQLAEAKLRQLEVELASLRGSFKSRK